MIERKSKFCAKFGICKKSGLSRMVLMSNGCTKYAECDDFFERKEKIKEKVISLKSSCFADNSCHRDEKKSKVDSGCLDCRDFQILSNGNLCRSVEFHLRCLDEYCQYGKGAMDDKCLDCSMCRVFSDKRQVWVEFRGGKDLKGNNF